MRRLQWWILLGFALELLSAVVVLTLVAVLARALLK